MTLKVHPPVYPVGQGTENIKHLMEASYKAIESGLPRELQGMVDNPDQ
jgi:1-acyl-sn-glycerol-3-phosphate acyltransferase